jgi:hypothetical protein
VDLVGALELPPLLREAQGLRLRRDAALVDVLLSTAGIGIGEASARKCGRADAQRIGQSSRSPFYPPTLPTSTMLCVAEASSAAVG